MPGKNYVIVKYDKILDDIDLRFVIINIFSKKPVSLKDSTIEQFSKIAQENNLVFRTNALKEDLATESGLYKSRDDARKAGLSGDFSAGFHCINNANKSFNVYKPVR